MRFSIADHEVEFSAIRAQGPGGQHVNKTATAIQLRFDIVASSLPEALKTRLLAWSDSRITAEGVIVIKSQGARSQLQNKAEAMERLHELIAEAAHVPRARKATKPTYGSKQRRLAGKSQRSELKAGRGKVQT